MVGTFSWENIGYRPTFGCCGETELIMTPPVRLYVVRCVKCDKKSVGVDSPERAVVVWDAMRRRENGG